MSYKYVAQTGVLASLAIILSYFEMLVPPLAPGVKLGLANIVVLLALYTLTPKLAFNISLVRVVCVGFLFGGVSTLMYSFTAALTSFTIMYLFKKSNLFSIFGVSIIGSFIHVTTQLCVSVLVLENTGLFTYLPLLTFSALITGFLIAYIGRRVVNHLVANNISNVG